MPISSSPSPLPIVDSPVAMSRSFFADPRIDVTIEEASAGKNDRKRHYQDAVCAKMGSKESATTTIPPRDVSPDRFQSA